MDDTSDPPHPGHREPPPPADRPLVLRRHSLAHLPDLKVDRSILETRYRPPCGPGNCDATCCRSGVGVDVLQRDQILAHADLIRRAMDADQERDPARWFEDFETIDPDFPSGRSVGTRVRGERCVFLDSTRRCVLQTATIAAARPGLDLKPFFCTAYPVTLFAGTLWVDELCYEGPEGCCRPAEGGALGVLDVCEAELRHMLGPEGLGELRRLIAETRP